MLGLDCLSFDEICHSPSRAVTVYNLFRDVVSPANQSPRDVTEIAALRQFLHWLTELPTDHTKSLNPILIHNQYKLLTNYIKTIKLIILIYILCLTAIADTYLIN